MYYIPKYGMAYTGAFRPQGVGYELNYSISSHLYPFEHWFEKAYYCRTPYDGVKPETKPLTKVTQDNLNMSYRWAFLRNYVFENCDMRGFNFRYSTLRNVRFIDCQMQGIDFTGALLVGCSFVECDTEGSIKTDMEFRKQ